MDPGVGTGTRRRARCTDCRQTGKRSGYRRYGGGLSLSALSTVASAKVNLYLHILGRRPDGYHDIESLIAFTEHGDHVRLEPSSAFGLDIGGPFGPDLARAGPNDHNLAVRAAVAFADRFGGARFRIGLEKHLPLAAGVGGGSADAGAVLRLLAGESGLECNDPALQQLAERLGADVPSCLAHRPTIATGLGEMLNPIDRLPSIAILLVNPRVALPTATVFREWTAIGDTVATVDPHAIANAKSASVLASLLDGTHNMLEPAAISIAPVITSVLGALRDAPGCVLARMSGSGATCFGLFDDDETAGHAAGVIGHSWPDWWVQRTRLRGEPGD